MTDTPHFWEELEAKLRQGIPGLPWPWLPGIQDFAHRESATLDSFLATAKYHSKCSAANVPSEACSLGLFCHWYCLLR